MKIRSKRFQGLKDLVTKSCYSVTEAISFIKKMGNAKFLEMIEAHIALNINPKYPNQQLRSTLTLPYNINNNKKIAVLTLENNISQILEFGASIVGYDGLIKDILEGNINFDVLLATPEIMPQLGKLGRILGPKGLMPSPKSGTVTKNLKETIFEYQSGKFEYKADKSGIVHLTFGKINFEENALIKNLLSIYSSIQKNKPIGVKGKYFKSFYICTTMSPSIELDVDSFLKLK